MMVMPFTPPNQDVARLDELHRYKILDTAPEEAFERIVELAQRLFNVPTVLISLVAEERQWFKARRGLKACETDLASSFCVHALEHDGVMIVLDASRDTRFRDTPLVTGKPFIRFYAGAPLKTPAGHTLGTLCLIDSAPHLEFTSEAQATLTDLAAIVIDELALRCASQAVQHHAERIETVFESITDAFYTLDRDWRFTYLNTQAELLLKHRREDLLGHELWAAFPETYQSTLYPTYLQALSTGVAVTLEYFYAPRTTWFEVHAYPSAEGLSVYFQNITARKEAQWRADVQAEFRRNLLEFTQQSLQRGLSDRFYQTLLEMAVRTIPGAQAGSLMIKREDGHHFIAAVGFDLEALSRCTFSADDFLFNLHSPEPQRVYSWQVQALDASRRDIMETHGLANNIAVSLCIPILIDGQPYLSLYLDNFDTPEAFDDEAVEMARVLTQQAAALMQRRELESALRHEQAALAQLAHYDAVTGLPNRRLLDDRLGQAAAHARRHGRLLGVMFLDLDNFKQINDTYGHAFGDRLLQAVASRLSHSLREGDTLARWGGDEFVVVVPDLDATAELAILAERLLAQLQQPFALEGREIRITATIGVDVSNRETVVAEDLIKNADIALYRAKATRGGYQFFTTEMREKLRVQVELGEELRFALRTKALTLHYQPRIELASGRIASFEALARWFHPSRGWIPPATFIPLAEELGLIRELGAQMLDQACAQARAWQDAGIARRIAVNLSIEQLKHPLIVEEVSDTLLKHGLCPQLLELEITESTAMTDVEVSIEKLQRFRERGVHLAIDDFGTAYSSLAYLDRLPVHSLKIDRSFIHNMMCKNAARRNGISIVQTILALGKSLGLCVVAEGVETTAQHQTLLRLGCDEAQGYLFAPPLSAADAQQLLSSGASFAISNT